MTVLWVLLYLVIAITVVGTIALLVIVKIDQQRWLDERERRRRSK